MENKNLIVTTQILEKILVEGVSIDLSYTFHTTSIVKHAVQSRTTKALVMDVHDFTASEMVRFVEYYYGNKILAAVGFSDASAIYYAICNKFPVVVDDGMTKSICGKLNVTCIQFEGIMKSRPTPCMVKEKCHDASFMSTKRLKINMCSENEIIPTSYKNNITMTG